MDLKQLRQKAAADFKERGFPTSREELWRFTDVSRVAQGDFSAQWAPAEVAFEPLEQAIVLVFENGQLSAAKSNLGCLPDGVHVDSILDRSDPRLGTLASDQSAFVAANTAYFSDGAFVVIEEGVVLERPLHILHLADLNGGAFHLRNFIAVGKGAKVTVVEEYIGAEIAQYWTNAVTEVFADEAAQVDLYKIQREGAQAFHFQTIESQLQARARFSNHAVTFGAALGRNDIRGKLEGEEGEAICNGLYLLDEKQHFDTHLFMDHAVAGCNSHELYKGILADKARAVFCGRILVQQDAQQTDAVQSNKNLLLSRSAKVNTLPQLEIYADDVKCTHGATVGELDEEALYYLQTRGIDPVRAHAMLTYAFANEVLDEMQSGPVKQRIEALVHAWLEGAAS